MSDEFRATAREQRDFEELGFFVRESVFSAEEVEVLRAGAENVHAQVLAAASRDDAPECETVDVQRYQNLVGSSIKWEWRNELHSVRSMEPCHHLDERLDALIDDPRLWGPVRDLIDCERLSLFSDKLNVKRPGGAPFPWHQEGPYWAYGADQVDKIVTALVYLDEGTRENGCFSIIAGSHKYGAIEGLRDRGTLGKLYTDIDRIEGEVVPFLVSAGSVVYFHYNVVHGSQSNKSDTDRRVFLAAYQPEGLRRWRAEGLRDIKPLG